MQTIEAQTTVRDLLTTYPQTFEVLVSHGMCQDCKTNPPPVPLQHFADKHCAGNLTGLLVELATAIES